MMDMSARGSVSSDKSFTIYKDTRTKYSNHRRSMSVSQPSSTESSSSAKSGVSFTFRKGHKKGQSSHHRRIKSMPQFKCIQNPHPISLSTLSSKGAPADFNKESETTFYVRLTLGYLTGIKTIAKKLKQNGNDHNIVVGYASLASTGTQLVLSQPFTPELDIKEKKTSNLIWASAVDDKAKKRQRLHFSLKLQKYCVTEIDDRDDNSVRSRFSFCPKVVKIVIGLKCGEEKVPLGIASLVVDGKTESNQKVDMALRPIDDATEKRQGLSKQRLNFFGQNKSKGKSFSEDCPYCLSTNATLRVKLDTKPGVAGLTKNEIWSDADNSLTRECASEVAHPQPGDAQFVFGMKQEHEVFLTPRNRRSRNFSISSVPTEYITISDENTFTSDISSRRSMFFDAPCLMANSLGMKFCGHSELCGDRNVILEESEELILIDNVPIDEIAKDNRFSYTSIKKGDDPSGQNNIDAPVAASSHMTVDTYEDLINAQETLRNYAKKTGIEIEDILEKAEMSGAN